MTKGKKLTKRNHLKYRVSKFSKLKDSWRKAYSRPCLKEYRPERLEYQQLEVLLVICMSSRQLATKTLQIPSKS